MFIGNLEVYGVVYKIRNKINNKVYIGRTIHGFDVRYGKKWYENTHNIKLLNSIKKYGYKNFEVVKILDVAFSNKELNTKEKHYISIYKSNEKKYGYNITSGGSYEYEEYRKKMSHSISNSEKFKKSMQSKEFSDKMSKNLKLRMENTNMKEIISKTQKESWKTKERRDKQKKILEERWSNEDYRNNVSNSIKKAWQDEIKRSRIINGMKKKYYLKNIETNEILEFLGREELAKHINKSVSYVKSRLNNNKLHDNKFIIYNKI